MSSGLRYECLIKRKTSRYYGQQSIARYLLVETASKLANPTSSTQLVKRDSWIIKTN